MAVSLASFLYGVMSKSVLIGELNSTESFLKLEQVYHGNKEYSCDTKGFTIHGIEYQKNIQENEIGNVLAERKQHIILDFGRDYRQNWIEFKRCEKCIIIGSLREWKIPSLIQFLEETKTEPEHRNWIYLVQEEDRVNRRDLEWSYHVSLITIPREEDPFHIKRENISFYQSILS